jgi:hypothetical protein
MKKSNKNFSENINRKYDIYEFRHAATLLKYDFPDEYEQLVELLEAFEISFEDVLNPGGGKSPIAKRFDSKLYSIGWEEKQWDINITIDGVDHPSPTHQVDYYKNKVAVELEWNNKTEFYDRDLNNFRLLHELDVISVGIIVTRATELQSLFKRLGIGAKYGSSTTIASKLLRKINGGGAAETPLLVFAINENAFKPETKKLIEGAE